MSKLSETITTSYLSGNKPKVNMNNKFTRRRMKLYEDIKNKTGENPDQELDYSRKILNENLPVLQRYVLSQNETPAPHLDNLIKQAYQLRCQQINAITSALNIPDRDAQILIEDDEHEADEIEANGADTFLKELAAPLGIAASRLQMRKKKDEAEADNLSGDVGSILGGVLGIAGTKINAGDLRRAAQNKPAGILGALGTGGTAHYNALRTYFQKNPSIAQQVINGSIVDESQLPNWNYAGLPAGANMINSNDITQSIADYQKKQAIKKALPFIIGGVIVLIIVIVLLVRRKK